MAARARLSRRALLRGAASLAAIGAGGSLLPAWARSASSWEGGPQLPTLTGTDFELSVGRMAVTIDGRRGKAIAVNGTVPAPLLRWREGETVSLSVENGLEADTSIHWHGLLLPPEMDGVPGVSFPGIHPGETFTYRFPVKQAGTYWYHSHSGFQEQLGHYGPIIIDPAGVDPVGFDREYVIVLADWTFANPHRIFARLKKMSDAYNFQRRTVRDFFREASTDGIGTTVAERSRWARMRMSPTDISDITGATYTYLVNGHGPEDNWTALFEPGQRVRLRVINASASTLFNVRIPGLPLTIVQSDGLDVRPVEVEEFQIGVAETYDCVVQPEADAAYTLVAESIDRSGMARATLAPRAGMVGEVPPLRERPLLTMVDMGMGDHGGMGHGSMDHGVEGSGEMDHGAMDHGATDHGAMDHGAMDHGAMDHGTMDHGAMGHETTSPAAGSPSEGEPARLRGPGVGRLAEAPVDRLGEPPAGLEDVGHRVLVYTDLVSLEPNPDTRPVGRELELHLTGNMERYMWSFDGRKFSEVVDPILMHENERLRMTLVNDTMMPHPIHLHGMFFEVVNGQTDHKPRKHTLVVKPGERCSIELTADAVGDWAFHCHLLYHMHAGMFRVVSVKSHGEVGG